MATRDIVVSSRAGNFCSSLNNTCVDKKHKMHI